MQCRYYGEYKPGEKREKKDTREVKREKQGRVFDVVYTA